MPENAVPFCSYEFFRALSQLHGLTKIARSGLPWKKTTERPIASVCRNCETA